MGKSNTYPPGWSKGWASFMQCRVADNSVWSQMGGDTPQLWNWLPLRVMDSFALTFDLVNYTVGPHASHFIANVYCIGSIYKETMHAMQVDSCLCHSVTATRTKKLNESYWETIQCCVSAMYNYFLDKPIHSAQYTTCDAFWYPALDRCLQ